MKVQYSCHLSKSIPKLHLKDGCCNCLFFRFKQQWMGLERVPPVEPANYRMKWQLWDIQLLLSKLIGQLMFIKRKHAISKIKRTLKVERTAWRKFFTTGMKWFIVMILSLGRSVWFSASDLHFPNVWKNRSYSKSPKPVSKLILKLP